MRPSPEPDFLGQVNSIVDTHLDIDTFNVERLAREVGLSRVQLYRRMLRSTGITPARFIRRRRLDRAARLLREEGRSVTETVYEVGLNNLSYFAKVFQQQYGMVPSAYAAQQ